ncbi:ATPase inhibitor mai-1, mitochondrial-like [Brevipalpus obovatus]|uniref:ATPase inhibitor mai-1, mitochondrial-like n=1 Tax=Brevipalpus obovatus TaxID=246614 RepID=UPI003D9F3427
MALANSNIIKLVRSSVKLIGSNPVRTMSNGSGEWGSGSGKGGGSGGSIRDAGGSFGRQEAAREEEFFRRQQREQLELLKNHLQEEINRNETIIKAHEDAVKSAKKKIEELSSEKK